MKKYFVTIIIYILPLYLAAQAYSFKNTSNKESNNIIRAKNRTGIVKTDTAYVFYDKGKKVLAYNYVPARLPENADQAYSKSGYIHPFYSPAGKILTKIQPPDHLHHYGIWNAWTKTVLNNRPVDFWNIGNKSGRVDYAGTVSLIERDKFSSLKVIQNHAMVNSGSNKETVLIESLEIKVYHKTENIFIADYISTYKCVNKNGLMLEEYRYGGFVLRGNENWGPETVNMLTSEGKTQDNSDGERAKWCLVTETGENPAGILILSHPENFNHPEPLRTWNLVSNNGKSNIFVNFCPIKNTNWFLESNKKYVLQYRIISFDGSMDEKDAEFHWMKYSKGKIQKL